MLYEPLAIGDVAADVQEDQGDDQDCVQRPPLLPGAGVPRPVLAVGAAALTAGDLCAVPPRVRREESR